MERASIVLVGRTRWSLPGRRLRARSLPALAFGVACVAMACSAPTAPVATDSAATESITTTASVPPPSASVAGSTGSAPSSVAVPVDGAGEECRSFTEGLDRFVFNRLQPIIERATELLHAPEGTDPDGPAAGLAEAAGQLDRLVEELDLMGVPPRELVDLLLSIREGTRLYAAGFEKGGRGWLAGDQDLIREARSEVSEASAVLTAYFGWRLCG